MPRQGAIAIASPITGDRVAMTNHPWIFSILALKDRFGFERLEVINDFTALALALPRLHRTIGCRSEAARRSPARRSACSARDRVSASPAWCRQGTAGSR